MLGKVIGITVTTLLVVAAIALACWFAFATITGATLVVFRTGSMAPTMPQGALAVTLPKPASVLQVGDVVTVQRANEALPVTHRIIEIATVDPQRQTEQYVLAFAPDSEELPDPLSSEARTLVLQGDANATPDRLPYVVTEVHKTVFAVPYMGTAVTLIQTPIGMGVITLGVAALVTWAFWPGRAAGDPDLPTPGSHRAHSRARGKHRVAA